MRRLFALLIFVCGSGLFGQITPDLSLALDRVSPDSLRGHLSFIASDLLAGRDTPSPGLDIAAEYIAAQFRRAGLEPAGDDGFFQTAKMVRLQPNRDSFSLTLTMGDKIVDIPSDHAVFTVNRAIDLKDVPLFRMDDPETVTQDELNGKAVILEISRGAMQRARAAMGKIRASTPALVIILDGRQASPSSAPLSDPLDHARRRPPTVSISGKEALQFYEGLRAGLASNAKASLKIAAPKEEPVVVRNVGGILRGSDPSLKNTYV